MTNPKTATQQSPEPPASLRDELCLVDGELRWRNPTGRRAKGRIGAAHRGNNGKVYLRMGYAGRLYYVHKVVLWYVSGYWGECDHIDGDGTNNHPDNLRPCTHSQNACNMRGWAASGHKGLYEISPGYYQAQVKLLGVKHSRCGRDKEELIAWLESKRKELHHEFTHHGK